MHTRGVMLPSLYESPIHTNDIVGDGIVGDGILHRLAPCLQYGRISANC